MMLTKISQHVFLFETKNSFLIKQPIINNFKMKISGEFIMSFRISTLCKYAGKKKPGTSFKLLLVVLYRWSLYL